MNISLKLMEEKEIELIRQWRNSHLINSVSFSVAHITPEMQRAWFEKISQDKNSLHWVLLVNDSPVGYASIKDIDLENRKCEFAALYLGDSDKIGTGIGAMAEYLVIDYVYSNFGLQKIFCQVLETNPKVIQLHKKFGFEVEGVLKDHYMKDGECVSVFILSLFKGCWESKKDNLKKILFR